MAEKKKRQIVAFPIYALIDDDAVILPNAKIEYCKEKDLPQEGNYYILGQNGMFLRKNTSKVNSIVKDSCPFLNSVFQTGQLRLPKVPPLIIRRALHFFQRVFQLYHAESEVMLLYNGETRQYDLWCPKQKVSGGSVEYEMSEELMTRTAGWDWVGTIHSHCDFSAYHSSVDEHDEKIGNGDGLHITLGHVNRAPTCSISCTAVMNGASNGVRHELLAENCIVNWKEQNSKYSDRHHYVSFKQDKFGIAELTDVELTRLKTEFSHQIQREWLPRVESKWKSGNYSGSQEEYLDTEEGRWVLLDGESWVFMNNEELDTYGYDFKSDNQEVVSDETDSETES